MKKWIAKNKLKLVRVERFKVGFNSFIKVYLPKKSYYEYENMEVCEFGAADCNVFGLKCHFYFYKKFKFCLAVGYI